MTSERPDRLLGLSTRQHNIAQSSPHSYKYPKLSMPPTENLTPAAVLPEAGQLIQVVDYTPSEGEQSCQIAASVDFTRQMEPTTRIRLVVGTRAIPTSVRELIDKTRGRWKVEGLIPAFSKQRMESRQVPLIIQAMDLDNLVIETVTFGEFIYRESGCHIPEKLIGTKRRQDQGGIEDTPAPHLKMPKISKFSPPPSPSLSIQRESPPPQSSSRRSRPHQQIRSHRRSNLASSRDIKLGTSLPDLQEQRAILQLFSSLSSITYDWDQLERKAGRRLVRFWKEQRGPVLQVSCESVTQDDYQSSDTVVSCIYRQEVDGYCITSVDIIYLLEKLLDDVFEVEEKNRIRRNLEGLAPTTITKHKLDHEAFFRQIMQFPEPRPRNIEKDVKVFDWDVLPQALDKIISKYLVPHHDPEDQIAVSLDTGAIPSPTSGDDYPDTDACDREALETKLEVTSFVDEKSAHPLVEDSLFAHIHPAVVDEHYTVPPSDVVYTCLDGSFDADNILSPTIALPVTSQSPCLSNHGSHAGSESWRANIKTEGFEDFIPTGVAHAYETTDAYCKGFGLHMYDHTEFQMLREYIVPSLAD